MSRLTFGIFLAAAVVASTATGCMSPVGTEPDAEVPDTLDELAKVGGACAVNDALKVHESICDGNVKGENVVYVAAASKERPVADGEDPADKVRAGIQYAINSCAKYTSKYSTKTCHVVFEKIHEYVLSRTGLSSHHSLVFDGSNVTAHGCGATIVNKTLSPSWWGDIVDVVGLIPGHLYPRLGKYAGDAQVTKSVIIRDLTIKDESISDAEAAEASATTEEAKNAIHERIWGHDKVPGLKAQNCIGLVHLEDVTLERVKCIHAPQTAIGAVSAQVGLSDPRTGHEHDERMRTSIKNLTLRNVTSEGSGQHAFRFHLQSGATTLSANLDHVCSRNVKAAEYEVPSRNGQPREPRRIPVHLYYRASLCDLTKLATLRAKSVAVAGIPPADRTAAQALAVARYASYRTACAFLKQQPTIEDASLRVSNSEFDDTANIVAYQGTSKLSLTNNRIHGGFFVNSGTADVATTGGNHVTLTRNVFGCESSKAAKKLFFVLGRDANGTDSTKSVAPVFLRGLTTASLEGNTRFNLKPIAKDDACIDTSESTATGVVWKNAVAPSMQP